MNVTLYTRAGCHLCDSAEATIRRVLGTASDVVLELVDIDADPDLVERYAVRVPVVAVDGVEIAQYEVDEQTLRAAILGPAGPPRSAVAAEPVQLGVRRRWWSRLRIGRP